MLSSGDHFNSQDWQHRNSKQLHKQNYFLEDLGTLLASPASLPQDIYAAAD